MKKQIVVQTFDWKEDIEAKKWISKFQKLKYKVYSYDTHSDTWIIIAVRYGNITKSDLEINFPPGYCSLLRLRLIKPIKVPHFINKLDYDTARTYIESKDEEFGGVF
jgi:hypothetical protein